MIIKKDIADMLLSLREDNPSSFNTIIGTILRYVSNGNEPNTDDMSHEDYFIWNMTKCLMDFDNRNAEQTKKD